jgi:hypothetical protein
MKRQDLKRSITFARAFAILLMATIVSTFTLAPQARASGAAGEASDEDDEVQSLPSADRAKRHLYPGGRDEQELTVQATLPQPTRNPESQGQTTSSEDSSAHD